MCKVTSRSEIIFANSEVDLCVVWLERPGHLIAVVILIVIVVTARMQATINM